MALSMREIMFCGARYLGQNVPLPNRTTSGTVSGADYTVWRNNFGKMAPGAATTALDAGGAVPEPASALFALILAVLAYFNRRTLRR